MENKSNKGIIICLVVIIVLLIGIIAYLLFGKDNKILTDITSSTTTTTTVKNSSTSELNLNTDERYSNYLTNLEAHIKNKYENYSNNVINGESMMLDTDISFTITKDLNLIFSTGNKKYSDYKLSENVLNMFLVDSGNGGYQYLYFIKNDGSLNKFCIDCLNEDNTPKIEKENLKNIVNVTQGLFDYEFSGYAGPIFINIEGNIIFGN